MLRSPGCQDHAVLAWGAQHLQGGCPCQQQLSAQFGHLRAVTSLGEVPPSCLQLTSSRPLKCFSSFWSPAACPFSSQCPSPPRGGMLNQRLPSSRAPLLQGTSSTFPPTSGSTC